MAIQKFTNFLPKLPFFCNGHLSEMIILNLIHSDIILQPRKRSTKWSMGLGGKFLTHKKLCGSQVGPHEGSILLNFLVFPILLPF